MHIPLIDEIALICALGVVTTVVLSRLRLPAVTGLLAAGALLGPHGLALTRSLDAIQVLAEVGVVLLLFTIGLEFSFTRLTAIFRQVAVGGVSQVVVTTGVVALVAYFLDVTPGPAVFYGFVFALSSTAIVLRGLTERREMDAPHGRFIVGTLIFQDLCVVPMVLIVPFLGDDHAGGGNPALLVASALGRAALVVAATIAIARLVVPSVLRWVDASRSREAFLLAILALCIGTAWMTSLVGLSLALGAFLGGMVVADSEFGHRASAEVLPLRDAFVSVFFVSLGMLFDVRLLVEQPVVVALFFVGFVALKGFLATLVVVALRFPARVAWLAGVGLAQFGEFGFVLAELGVSTHVIAADALPPLLAAGILSMIVTPVLVRAAPHVTAGERLLAPIERLIGVRGVDDLEHHGDEQPSGHVIVVGYGLAGRLLTAALLRSGHRAIALELNAESVRAAKQRKEPVYYADATSEEALGHAHVAAASAVVVLINDPLAAQRVVSTARRVAPAVPIFVRARYLAEGSTLAARGANDVVAEELEGGVEVIARVLHALGTPRNVVEQRLGDARRETHASARRFTMPRDRIGEAGALADLKIEKLALSADAPAVGKSLRELGLRTTTGALVVGVARGGTLLDGPAPDERFLKDDVLYVVGRGPSLRHAAEILTLPEAPPP